uniref:THAP domain-containing protein 1 n=1 Tax=Gadus morhua TaxID=8049 RepID=A0A8C5BEJ2_GADMO
MTFHESTSTRACTSTVVAKSKGVLRFHSFPSQTDVRSQWIVNMRRDKYVITTHSKICSRHFSSDKMIEPTTLQGRRRLTKGAVVILQEVGLVIELHPKRLHIHTYTYTYMYTYIYIYNRPHSSSLHYVTTEK